jgi:hypothetical protein
MKENDSLYMQIGKLKEELAKEKEMNEDINTDKEI